MSVAFQAIKKFRLHELKGLQAHVARHGPLPTSHSEATVLPNPFLARKNPNTGKWSPSKYSLRRQAELIKKAKAANLLHLLPPGPKNPRPELLQQTPVEINTPSTSNVVTAIESNAIEAAKDEHGSDWALDVAWDGKLPERETPGAEIGTRLYAARKRMFKGHRWERLKEDRERKRRVLVRDMAKRVASFKAYHQRRRPNPLKPALAKSRKLPF